MFNWLKKVINDSDRLNKQLEVKELAVTDLCANCGSPQGGYVSANLDRYVNVRDGHKCASCGVSEEKIDP
jgi:hypothetical protein